MRILGLALMLTTFSVAPAFAQGGSYQVAKPAAAAVRLTAPTPVVFPAATSTDVDAARRFNSRAPGATMMIIGGAAFVAGLFVNGSGGTVLIVGGLALGAYGFYLYTR